MGRPVSPLALLESEGNYLKLIDYIDEKISYNVISLYASRLILKAPQRFLEKLVNRIDYQEDFNWNQYEPETLNTCLEELYILLSKHYSVETLTLIAKKGTRSYGGWSNLFVKYLNQRITKN